jgi:hypothetical protein
MVGGMYFLHFLTPHNLSYLTSISKEQCVIFTCVQGSHVAVVNEDIYKVPDGFLSRKILFTSDFRKLRKLGIGILNGDTQLNRIPTNDPQKWVPTDWFHDRN